MSPFAQLEAFRGGKGLVRLVGHRGARGIMPENTLEGFAFTLGIGVRALEFDVVLTRDLIPVITHNCHLATSATRTNAGAWISPPEPRVADLTFAELQHLDVGGLDGKTIYGQRFPDQVFLDGIRIPRLSDLLRLACSPGMEDVHLLLELKSDPASAGDPDANHSFVAAVIAEVRSHALQQRTILHSFDWTLLDECRRQAPEMPTSYLTQHPDNADDPGEDSAKEIGPDYANLSLSLPQAVQQVGGQMWCPYFEDVTPEQVREAHELGLLVTTWTVNAPQDIARMIEAGVDGIVSDYPGRVQRCLLDRGLDWRSLDGRDRAQQSGQAPQ